MKTIAIFCIVMSLVLFGCSKEIPTGNFALNVDKACTDSDGGQNIKAQGTVTVIDENGDDSEYEDRCISGLLVEYSCEGDKLSNQNIRCPNKCSNGACT